MTRHFLDLTDARVVPTDHLVLTHRAIRDVNGSSAMGIIHGQAGLGKTFAVERAVGMVRPGHTCWVSFPSRPTMRLVASELLAAVTGVPSPNNDRFRLMARLAEELRSPHRLIVVDEAQHLNTECVELLRFLHDDPRTDFALVLVGGDGTWEVLSREPMLRSRVFRRVTFRPLRSNEVLELMREYHPIYSDVGDDLLMFIDDQFAHGNLRNWASFTLSAAALQRPLDESVARNVFTLLAGKAG